VQIDVNIDDRIGGPSAGMVFALAIYDTLTPGALLDGMHIAGTGMIGRPTPPPRAPSSRTCWTGRSRSTIVIRTDRLESDVKYFLQSIGPLVLDFLSTIAFVIALSVLHDTQKAILVGLVVGVLEIGWIYARTRKLSIMQAASLFLVITLGGASLITRDPRFVMI